MSPAGNVVRPVTPKEEEALSNAKKRVRAVGKSGSANIGFGAEEKRARFEVVKTGPKRDAFVIETYLDGLRYVKGRDIITARIVAQHGECILLGTNGKRLTIARDSRRVRALADARIRAASKTGGSLGEHLDDIMAERGLDPVGVGPYGVKFGDHELPPHQRRNRTNRHRRTRSIKKSSRVIADAAMPNDSRDFALSPDGHRMSHAEQSFRANMKPPTAALHQAASLPKRKPVSEAVYSPDDCPNDCRGFKNGTAGWAWPPQALKKDDLHHPTCQYAAAWKRANQKGPVQVLYDLDRRRELRPATDQEIAEAEQHAKAYGTPAVTIGSRQYAVIDQGAFDAPEVEEVDLDDAEPKVPHYSATLADKRAADRLARRARIEELQRLQAEEDEEEDEETVARRDFSPRQPSDGYPQPLTPRRVPLDVTFEEQPALADSEAETLPAPADEEAPEENPPVERMGDDGTNDPRDRSDENEPEETITAEGFTSEEWIAGADARQAANPGVDYGQPSKATAQQDAVDDSTYDYDARPSAPRDHRQKVPPQNGVLEDGSIVDQEIPEAMAMIAEPVRPYQPPAQSEAPPHKPKPQHARAGQRR